ncbi:MAG: hypothetical protein M1833_003385 [Piccolia ochrophora]|nr:MAG: hypothetical protein M1833_003385 [Piccolia ochrophora]
MVTATASADGHRPGDLVIDLPKQLASRIQEIINRSGDSSCSNLQKRAIDLSCVSDAAEQVILNAQAGGALHDLIVLGGQGPQFQAADVSRALRTAVDYARNMAPALRLDPTRAAAFGAVAFALAYQVLINQDDLSNKNVIPASALTNVATCMVQSSPAVQNVRRLRLGAARRVIQRRPLSTQRKLVHLEAERNHRRFAFLYGIVITWIIRMDVNFTIYDFYRWDGPNWSFFQPWDPDPPSEEEKRSGKLMTRKPFGDMKSMNMEGCGIRELVLGEATIYCKDPQEEFPCTVSEKPWQPYPRVQRRYTRIYECPFKMTRERPHDDDYRPEWDYFR